MHYGGLLTFLNLSICSMRKKKKKQLTLDPLGAGAVTSYSPQHPSRQVLSRFVTDLNKWEPLKGTLSPPYHTRLQTDSGLTQLGGSTSWFWLSCFGGGVPNWNGPQFP